MQEDTECTKRPNPRLRRAREERGWTRKQVALEIQHRWPYAAVTEDDIGRWENGKRHPSPYYRYKLCEIFGMKAAELGLLEDEPEPASLIRTRESIEFRLTPEQVTAFRQLLSLGDTMMKHFDPSKRKAL